MDLRQLRGMELVVLIHEMCELGIYPVFWETTTAQ
jgi:hypothetical protein